MASAPVRCESWVSSRIRTPASAASSAASAESAGGDRVGLLRRLAHQVRAGEHPHERGAEIAGQVQQGADVRQHRLVVAGRGHPHVSGETEGFDTGRLELGGHLRAFVRAEAWVHRFLRVRAQFDPVVAVFRREAEHIGEGETGDAESGERQLHTQRPYSSLRPRAQIQPPVLPDEILTEGAVRLLGDEHEAVPLVDPAGGGEHVVRPQDQLAVAGPVRSRRPP
ncbi:hypothetical protein SGLAM104S_09368 [Streptomyces glaucescens]